MRPDPVPDPLADFEAEFTTPPKSDEEVVVMYLAVAIAAGMLGAKDMLNAYAAAHPELNGLPDGMTPVEFVEHLRGDALARGREIDRIERNCDDLSERLAQWLRDHGLGKVELWVPVPTPAGIMMFLLVLNKDGRAAQIGISE